MRLIDADALIEKWYEANKIGPEDRGARFIGYTEIPRFINNAPTVERSEQYKKGFEDAKRAFGIEYARESENMRKRNAQLEVMLNAQKALSADAVQGEWIDIDNYYRLATCSCCHKVTMFEKWGEHIKQYDYCPNCGAKMKGGDDE